MMLNSLHVENLRAFRSGSIGPFSKINILIGPNGSGKTTFLQAAFFLGLGGRAEKLLEIAASHGSDTTKINSGHDLVGPLRWLYHRRNPESPIVLGGDIDGRTLKVEYGLRVSDGREAMTLPTSGDTDDESSLEKPSKRRLISQLEIKVDDDGESKRAGISLYPDSGEKEDVDTSVTMPMRLLRAVRPLSASGDAARAWTQCEEEGTDESVVEILRAFDPAVQGIRVAASWDGEAVVRVRHARLGIAPLSVFGDGFVQLYRIATEATRVPGGAILIDEFDSPLHIDMIDAVVPFLESVATSGTHGGAVQLFLTTHRLDTIDALLDGLTDVNDLSIHRFVLDDSGCAKVRTINGQAARELRHSAAIDFRRSQ